MLEVRTKLLHSTCLEHDVLRRARGKTIHVSHLSSPNFRTELDLDSRHLSSCRKYLLFHLTSKISGKVAARLWVANPCASPLGRPLKSCQQRGVQGTDRCFDERGVERGVGASAAKGLHCAALLRRIHCFISIAPLPARSGRI